MGVRGLTTFIAKNADKYLEDYKLHDTYLVIDGNNIASHLYKWNGKSNDCFGGDYDKYSKTIHLFYNVLSQCKVTPLIIFDGGYEDKKLKTVFSRMRSRITAARKLNTVTECSVSLFPLFIREVFLDVSLKLKVKVVRCDFEADYEMACLARTLQCPLLSYDSDFFIFDVLYIPFSTLDLKVTIDECNYIECRLYKVDRFLKYCGNFDRTSLPLLAVLSGNDYISKSLFANFYSQMTRGRNLKRSHEHIRLLITWLSNETYDSAVTKILERLKLKQRDFVAKQIKYFAGGYICKESYVLKYLNLKIIDNLVVNSNCSTSNDANAISSNDPVINLNHDTSNEDVVAKDEPVVNKTSKNVPNWFLERYRKCLYPCCFMDILFQNTYFCVPQLEDHSDVNSHEISLNILSAIQKILQPEQSNGLVCVIRRNHSASLSKLTLPIYEKKLPTIDELRFLKKQPCKELFFEVLDLNIQFEDEILAHFPDQFKLFITALVYWIKNAQVLKYQIYSLIMCSLVLMNADTTFHQQSKLKPEGFWWKDSLKCKSRLKSAFGIDPKMRTNVKLYDIRDVHVFAQFQSVLLHIKYLNALLNRPYENVIVSNFFNGTFVYNLCANFSKRTDLDGYIDLFLKDSSNVLGLFRNVTELLGGFVDLNCNPLKVKKKRRKRKARKVDVRSIDVEVLSCNEDDPSFYDDVNNKFSLLGII